MIIGFTGSRHGMSLEQRVVVEKVCKQIASLDGKHQFHHGDCIGADAEAHDIFKKAGFETHIHPPRLTLRQAHCQGDVCYPPDDYIPRDRRIVETCEVLIGTPKELKEVLRSGSWATIRHARRTKTKCLIVLRDGTYVKENYG